MKQHGGKLFTRKDGVASLSTAVRRTKRKRPATAPKPGSRGLVKVMSGFIAAAAPASNAATSSVMEHVEVSRILVRVPRTSDVQPGLCDAGVVSTLPGMHKHKAANRTAVFETRWYGCAELSAHHQPRVRLVDPLRPSKRVSCEPRLTDCVVDEKSLPTVPSCRCADTRLAVILR